MESYLNVGIIGLGFVGNAIYQSLKIKGLIDNKNLFIYDKYKNGGIGKFEDCLNTEIAFLALPTQYDYLLGEYDKTSIYAICDQLEKNNYNGTIVLKSTVEPETSDKLSSKYPGLSFIHNPEFLTARTAIEDFHNQSHIVLGQGKNCSEVQLNLVRDFYQSLFPKAEISLCTSLESESMKIFCNTFYAVKVQYFTELYLICQKNGSDYDKIRDMMLKNGWINKMHTVIPGPDGQLSYGGLCFPKDTNALLKYMDKLNTDNKVLKATVEERNDMREDHENCKKV
jgi:UDPglucose 6-dehydrogenase